MSNGQKVAYIRVSSAGQNPDRQLQDLELDKIFLDRVSGKSKNRPELKKCIDYLRDSDTLYVHSLDRLARSLIDLESVVSELVEKGVTVTFQKENISFSKLDNGSSMQRLLFQILGSFSEFERNLIRERQAEGIEKAKQQGKHLGRPSSLSKKQKDEIISLFQQGNENISALAKKFHVSRATIYNVLGKLKKKS